MIHHNILHQIKKEKQHESFIYPYYGKYSIAEVPSTILSYFGIKTGRASLPFTLPVTTSGENKKLLFFFVDGFGFDHFADYHSVISFFNTLSQKGDVYPLTSVFPSTTPAALTTLHTNLTPQEHGLPEWTVYFEEFDRIIETFPFRPMLTQDREVLLSMGGHPEMLFKGTTIYQTMKEHHVNPYVFIYEEYALSAYSRQTQQGATVVPFSNAQDLFSKIVDVLHKDDGPTHLFVYWSYVDSTGHVFGPRSKEHIDSLQSLSHMIEEQLLSKVKRETAEQTLFLMTSDHGLSSIKGEDIIYLNDYLELESNYLKSPSLQSIYPTGAPHDVFLYIYDPKIPETISLLKKKLDGKAEILKIEDAVKRGLFGLNTPTDRFLRRIGDILILPYEGYHVWYKHAPNMHYGQRGMHGGLSQQEMIVPFIVAPLSHLITS